MPKITLQTGDISSFSGDAIIVPSDVAITNKRANRTVEKILEKGGSDLLSEASVIGYCEIGNAVRTKGYDLDIQHIIFLPYVDSENPDNTIDITQLHLAFRSAFTLASLYEVKTLAVPLLRFKRNRSFKDKLLNFEFLDLLSDHSQHEAFREGEVEDIIMAVSSEFEQSIQEVVIYKRFN